MATERMRGFMLMELDRGQQVLTLGRSELQTQVQLVLDDSRQKELGTPRYNWLHHLVELLE
jgi:hypothetical protein